MIKLKGLSLNTTIYNGRFTSRESYNVYIFKQIPKILRSDGKHFITEGGVEDYVISFQ